MDNNRIRFAFLISCGGGLSLTPPSGCTGHRTICNSGRLGGIGHADNFPGACLPRTLDHGREVSVDAGECRPGQLSREGERDARSWKIFFVSIFFKKTHFSVSEFFLMHLPPPRAKRNETKQGVPPPRGFCTGGQILQYFSNRSPHFF